MPGTHAFWMKCQYLETQPLLNHINVWGVQTFAGCIAVQTFAGCIAILDVESVTEVRC